MAPVLDHARTIVVSLGVGQVPRPGVAVNPVIVGGVFEGDTVVVVTTDGSVPGSGSGVGSAG